MKPIYVFLMVVIIFVATSSVTFAAPGAKAKNAKEIIVYEKGFSPKQKAALLEIANAIRSGSAERISKYTKDGEDPNAIKVFWSGVDELANLKFRARTWENARNTSEKGFILSDAANGMSSCNLIKKGNHFVIGGCVFNDGN